MPDSPRVRFDPATYDARRAEVREMIDEADRQDDHPMGPDGLADALMEIAEGWTRAALATPAQPVPSGLREAAQEYIAAMTDFGKHGLHRDPQRCVTAWNALVAATPPAADTPTLDAIRDALTALWRRRRGPGADSLPPDFTADAAFLAARLSKSPEPR